MSLDIKRSEGRKGFDDGFDEHMEKVTPEERKKYLEDWKW